MVLRFESDLNMFELHVTVDPVTDWDNFKNAIDDINEAAPKNWNIRPVCINLDRPYSPNFRDLITSSKHLSFDDAELAARELAWFSAYGIERIRVKIEQQLQPTTQLVSLYTESHHDIVVPSDDWTNHPIHDFCDQYALGLSFNNFKQTEDTVHAIVTHRLFFADEARLHHIKHLRFAEMLNMIVPVEQSQFECIVFDDNIQHDAPWLRTE